jgi:hypothetical protein
LKGRIFVGPLQPIFLIIGTRIFFNKKIFFLTITMVATFVIKHYKNFRDPAFKTFLLAILFEKPAGF